MEMTFLEKNLIEVARIFTSDGMRYGSWSAIYRDLKDKGLVSEEAYKTIYRLDTGWDEKSWGKKSW